MPAYVRPSCLDEALGLMAPGNWMPLAGGTDIYPALGSRPLKADILDLGAIGELRGLTEDGDTIVIGAGTSWTDILRANLPSAFDMLKQAACEVGSIQIQNAGTIAGNLCNASPAADGVPPLLALDAVVELRSAASMRRLPLSAFLLDNRRTARKPDELMTSIRIPRSAATGRSGFVKLGTRRYLVISIAMTAVRLELAPGGRVGACAVAVGSCSAVARRLPALEARLTGLTREEALAQRPDPADLAPLSPIDDVRGSAAYRLDAASEIVARAIRMALAGDAGTARAA